MVLLLIVGIMLGCISFALLVKKQSNKTASITTFSIGFIGVLFAEWYFTGINGKPLTALSFGILLVGTVLCIFIFQKSVLCK